MPNHSFHSLQENSFMRTRPYMESDRAFVFSLAPRLVIGIPPWRSPERMLEAVQGWLTESIEQYGKKTMLFIAEDERGKQLGFASVSHQQHFTGVKQAYIGELATSEEAEGQGVGGALLAACEQWAREQGYMFLVLQTGAANHRALSFYARRGFLREDVTLVKQL